MQLNPFNDNYFMKEALKEAQKALEKNEVPVGCVDVAHARAASQPMRAASAPKMVADP